MLKPDRGREILYFIKTCQLIICICYDALMDIYTRNGDNKSFVKAGLVKYLNHVNWYINKKYTIGFAFLLCNVKIELRNQKTEIVTEKSI